MILLDPASTTAMAAVNLRDTYQARSTSGHFFLTTQILSPHVLPAALLTRFAILFTAGGPAGKFSKPDKKSKRGERGGRGEGKPQMNAD